MKDNILVISPRQTKANNQKENIYCYYEDKCQAFQTKYDTNE